MHIQRFKTYLDGDGSEDISSFVKWSDIHKLQMVIVYDGTNDHAWTVTFADPNGEQVIVGSGQHEVLAVALYAAFTKARLNVKPSK
jgi:hypothetical protein